MEDFSAVVAVTVVVVAAVVAVEDEADLETWREGVGCRVSVR